MRNLISLIPGVIVLLNLIACESMDSIDESLPLEQKIDQLVEPIVVFGNPNATIIGIIQNGEILAPDRNVTTKVEKMIPPF